MTLLLFVAGLVALVAGAELLVHGASRLALPFGISPRRLPGHWASAT